MRGEFITSQSGGSGFFMGMRARFCALAAWAVLAGCAANDPLGVEALYRADTILARGDASPREHLDALELAASAQSGVFDARGELARIDYPARYADTLAAIEQAGSPPDLMDRLAQLPSAPRGALPERVRIRASQASLDERIRFAGGEPAIVYVRAEPAERIDVTIETESGREICSKRRSSGRVICRWNPAVEETVRIRARYAGQRRAAGRLSIFTN